jgi:Cof subfamily protein (haloacid dehalogenase superfamily)
LPKPIRLLVTDLDGTLLTSDHIVSPFTAEAVREAIARGVLFTIATGKTFPSTTHLIQQFGIHVPLICANGTQVFAPDGTLLYEDPIPLDLAIEAVQLAMDGGFTPVVYVKNGLLVPYWDANVEEVVAHHEPVPQIAPDLVAALKTDEFRPYKIILMKQDPQAVSDLHLRLIPVFDGRAQVIRSGLASVMEVLPLGATKGTALMFILKHLGIAPEEAMCFGDNCNDLDMIQLAGIGVSMGHAPEEVRFGADYVTGTNDEDGVGHAIHKFLLNSQAVGA